MACITAYQTRYICRIDPETGRWVLNEYTPITIEIGKGAIMSTVNLRNQIDAVLREQHTKQHMALQQQFILTLAELRQKGVSISPKFERLLAQVYLMGAVASVEHAQELGIKHPTVPGVWIAALESGREFHK